MGIFKRSKSKEINSYQSTEISNEECTTQNPIGPKFKESNACFYCLKKFHTPKRPRHHCRNCGESCCKKCLSKTKRAMPWFEMEKPEKICIRCERQVCDQASHESRVSSVSVRLIRHSTGGAIRLHQEEEHPVRTRREKEKKRGKSERFRVILSSVYSYSRSMSSFPIRPFFKRNNTIQRLRNQGNDLALQKLFNFGAMPSA
jgi:hypothetical protein